MTELLPLFLKVAGRRVVLVGAGAVALGKLRGLLAAGAEVMVVAPEALMRTARDLAMKIMSKGMYGVRQAKQAINEGVELDIDAGLCKEADGWTACFTTHDQKEGMEAFVEKRKPTFKDF